MGTAHDNPMNPKAFIFFATHHEIPALLLSPQCVRWTKSLGRIRFSR
jgi:hypothetical protein